MQNYPGAGDAQEGKKESAAVAIIRQQPNGSKKCFRCENSHKRKGFNHEKNSCGRCAGTYNRGQHIIF